MFRKMWVKVHILEKAVSRFLPLTPGLLWSYIDASCMAFYSFTKGIFIVIINKIAHFPWRFVLNCLQWFLQWTILHWHVFWICSVRFNFLFKIIIFSFKTILRYIPIPVPSSFPPPIPPTFHLSHHHTLLREGEISHGVSEAQPRFFLLYLGWTRYSSIGNGSKEPIHALVINTGSPASGSTNCSSHTTATHIQRA